MSEHQRIDDYAVGWFARFVGVVIIAVAVIGIGIAVLQRVEIDGERVIPRPAPPARRVF